MDDPQNDKGEKGSGSRDEFLALIRYLSAKGIGGRVKLTDKDACGI